MNATQWILLVHATGIALDIALALNSTPNHIDTISARLKVVSAVCPLWLYSIAMLLGHFGLNNDWGVAEPYNIWVLIAIGVAWFCAGTWLRGHVLTDTEIFWTNLVAINTGWVSGMLLWPQRPLDGIPNLL
jgi:hypothetical protein